MIEYRIKLAKGRYRLPDGRIALKIPPPRGCGHNRKCVVWRDEKTGEWLGYSLGEAVRLATKRARDEQDRLRERVDHQPPVIN